MAFNHLFFVSTFPFLLIPAIQIALFNEFHPQLCMKWLSAPVSQLVIERRLPRDIDTTSDDSNTATAAAAAPMDHNETAAAADDLITMPIAAHGGGGREVPIKEI